MSPLILILNITMLMAYDFKHLDGLFIKLDITDAELFLRHFSNVNYHFNVNLIFSKLRTKQF